ncbi:RDD family protein [Rubellicoccus peritrichatus]|uniref:RDD family protein n=1 Tax=Rubellicoccus peritrichatus TaxID=3080537 RepID=A0AAQ3LGL9_9BACT|nr:RDD family protein [Puniceicoccus sp. CR14]WOO43453.1 RDD family protein [Puniceicoccus sp. CR14]
MKIFYLAEGQQQGPVTEIEILSLYNNSTVNDETLIWYEQLNDWTPLSRVKSILLPQNKQSRQAPAAAPQVTVVSVADNDSSANSPLMTESRSPFELNTDNQKQNLSSNRLKLRSSSNKDTSAKTDDVIEANEESADSKAAPADPAQPPLTNNAPPPVIPGIPDLSQVQTNETAAKESSGIPLPAGHEATDEEIDPLEQYKGLAGFGHRTGAFLLDWLIIGLANFIITGIIVALFFFIMTFVWKNNPYFFEDHPMYTNMQNVGIIAIMGVFNLTPFFISAFFISRFMGSPGQLILGLNTIHPDGALLTLVDAFKRSIFPWAPFILVNLALSPGVGEPFGLAFIILSILSVVFAAVCYFWFFKGDSKQCLQDKVCHTVVCAKR